MRVREWYLMASSPSFAQRLIAWQRRHGRHGLPWQGTTDPYRIWLSEIMLQQTQVAAVIPYYRRFVQRFPDVQTLAGASQDEVLTYWSGLGYYARGRNLHAAAQQLVQCHGGRFPRTAREIEALPGIGRSTASAIAAFAFGERTAILDGNVKRVLARYHGVAGWPGEAAVQARLWQLAEKLLPSRQVEAYTQGLMDLGATVCTRAKPSCGACPVGAGCIARRKGLSQTIPAPRPRQALPRRQATWLVLVFQNEILLERRPPSGIWGGLWAFPEAHGQDIGAFCRRSLGCEIGATRALEPFEHGFTHFRLSIRPLLCPVRRIQAGAQEGGQRLWIDLEAARGAALPTPVRKLLEAYSAARGEGGLPTAPAAPALRRAARAESRRAGSSPRRSSAGGAAARTARRAAR